jgi:hypothetical protein
MTLPIPTLDPEHRNLQFILDRLVQSGVDTGGRQVKVRFGSGTITWPGGAATSNQLTVAHGMGGTPTNVYLTMTQPANFNTLFRESAAADATNIYVRGVVSDLVTAPAAASTQKFHWLAIG